MVEPVKSGSCSTKGINSFAKSYSVGKGKPKQTKLDSQFHDYNTDNTIPSFLFILKAWDTPSKANQAKIRCQLYTLFVEINGL